MERLVLIDGHAVLHRAFHALPKSLTNRAGQPVNAVYGFSRMLLKIIKDLRPSHLIVAFDLPGKNFRHQLAPDYQATRPKMADELTWQIKPVQEVIRAFQAPMLTQAGFEADDVLGTLASQARLKSKAKEIIIITGDKDLLQLVDSKTKVYLLQKGISAAELVDEKRVKVKLGVQAAQVVDYKALVGDPSDNYPGVSGIGPKTSQELLGRYQSLAGIYQHLDGLPDRLRAKLKKDKKQAELSQKLARIRRDLKLEIDWQTSELNYDPAAVKEVFEKYRFKSLIEELEKKGKEQMRLL